MKLLFAVTLMAVVLNSGIANASHELVRKATEPVAMDAHITWHEFRHELRAYVAVTASISDTGVVTLHGNANDGQSKNRIEGIARIIRGATEVRSYIRTK